MYSPLLQQSPKNDLQNEEVVWHVRILIFLLGWTASNQFEFCCLWQDESSSSDEDDDDGEWGSDTVGSGSESSDDGEGKSSSLAMVFLKKWVSLSTLSLLDRNSEGT